MIGIITGITDSGAIEYCPKCGEKIYRRYADGTVECEGCHYRFGVVDCDDDETEVD